MKGPLVYVPSSWRHEVVSLEIRLICVNENFEEVGGRKAEEENE